MNSRECRNDMDLRAPLGENPLRDMRPIRDRPNTHAACLLTLRIMQGFTAVINCNMFSYNVLSTYINERSS